MYIFPNTTIKILKGVPLDNTYNDTIFFESETKQREHFATYQGRVFSNQTYQRVNRGTIRLQVKADDIYDYNYLMFQNTSYGSKWFYAFITRVEYVNDATSEINYEIDEIQTWFFETELRQSFVEREHSANDGIGVNRTPEPLQVNDYVTNVSATIDVPPDYIYMGLSEKYEDGYKSPDFRINSDGIPQAFERYGGDISVGTLSLLQLIYNQYVEDGKANDLITIQTFPSFNDDTHITIPHPVNLDGYAPKNKKMLQYPYCKLVVTNNLDTQSEFAFEDFSENEGKFYFHSCTSGVPQVITYPHDYRGMNERYDLGIIIGNYPQVPCGADSFSAYIGNQALNMGFSAINSATNLSISALSPVKPPTEGHYMEYADRLQNKMNNVIGDTGNVISAGIQNIVNTYYTASRLPDEMHGASGGNYLAMSAEAFKFLYMTQTIRSEIAREIDDFFTRFGYATRKLKVPNRNVRPHWCYTKTISCNVHGDVPTDSLSKISSIYDNGITFWKNGNEVGHYELDNSV